MARSRCWWRVGFGVLLLAIPACMTPGAAAPAVPAAAAAAGAGGAGGLGAAGGVPGAVAADPELAPPTTALGKCCEAIMECRRRLCKSPAGQLLNGMTQPLSALTGGVIPTFCPPVPGAKDLMKPGVEGEAAAAKKDAAEAKARKEAVRYMGTLDCRYYADAEGKLIAALRTDGVECVRLEAAMVLGRGCCCTEKVIRALEITVAGTEEDGNPAERSPRVRDAAAESLAHCLSCAPPKPVELPEPMKEGEKVGEGAESKAPINQRTPKPKTVEHARATLEAYRSLKATLPAASTEEKSIYGLFKGSDNVRPAPLPSVDTTVEAPAPTPAPATTEAKPTTPDSVKPAKLILPE